MIAVSVCLLAALCLLRRKRQLERPAFLLLLCLHLACLTLTVSQTLLQEAAPVTELQRNERGEGDAEIPMIVRTESGEETELFLSVPERRVTEAEAEALLTRACAVLDAEILGENEAFSRITQDLRLPQTVTDAGISVQWSTDAPELLNWDGTLGDQIDPAGETVQLTGVLTLQESSCRYQRTLTVYPAVRERSLSEQLQQEAEALNQEEEAVYRLPSSVNGEKLTWYRKQEQSGQALSLFCILGLLAAVLSGRQKKEKAEERRRQQLLRDYPELVSRLQLMLSAGLPMRTAAARISERYRAGQAGRKKKQPREAYEQLARACLEMKNGISEQEAYERFGARCGIPQYRRLALLLTQNLKKGGQGLLPLLEQEAHEAFETRKRRARAESEKASVRLLLPMGMMLLVVLAVILIPALISF